MSQAPEPTIGLIVPVVQAEELVRAAQVRFEPNSPAANLTEDLTAAHVTILWPFLPPNQIDRQIVIELGEICARHPRHAFILERVAVFPGGTVHLLPEPSNALLELMHAVWKRWPEFPPYGGVHTEVIPHVTLAAVECDQAHLQQILSFAASFLPIYAEARELQVILVRDNTWTLLHRLPLGDPVSSI